MTLNPPTSRWTRKIAAAEAAHAGKVADFTLFDPPFRWTTPRDVWERASADQGYATLQAFLRDSKHHLKKTGRIIVHFGTSGDLAYLKHLIRMNGFRRKQLLKTSHPQGWEYFIYRLTLRTTEFGDSQETALFGTVRLFKRTFRLANRAVCATTEHQPALGS